MVIGPDRLDSPTEVAKPTDVMALVTQCNHKATMYAVAAARTVAEGHGFEGVLFLGNGFAFYLPIRCAGLSILSGLVVQQPLCCFTD